MARISLKEIIAVVAQHPDYYERWFADVAAEESLYITLGERPVTARRSETFDAVDGSHIVLDLEGDGRVLGIEIT